MRPGSSVALARRPVHLALLGLMAELGDHREPEHRRIAALAEQVGIDVVGYGTNLYCDAQVRGLDEAVALVRTMGPGDAALVKGSRVARLEDVVMAYGDVVGVRPLNSNI